MTKWILAVVVVLVLAGSLAVSGSASAKIPAPNLPEGSVPASPEEEADFQVALSFWAKGVPPRCSEVNLRLAPLILSDDGERAAGISEVPGYAPSIVTCEIVADASLAPRELCVIVTHETGHLFGLGHSTDPANIMYPNPNPAVLEIPGCPEEQSAPRPADLAPVAAASPVVAAETPASPSMDTPSAGLSVDRSVALRLQALRRRCRALTRANRDGSLRRRASLCWSREFDLARKVYG